MSKKVNAPKAPLKGEAIVCPSCETENKAAAKVCKACGYDFSQPVLWTPTWRWHLKVLGGVYLSLTIIYFVVSYALLKAPEPYKLRDRPPEVTPWLK